MTGSSIEEHIKEHKINNIKLYHLDILNIKELEKEYDIINFDLVIDDLENHQKGLDCILNVLKKNGLIRFGIESKSAHNIFKIAKKEISSDIKIKKDINEETIKKIRNYIRYTDNVLIKNLILSNKFHSKNDFIKLFFPIKEPSFNINMIKELLEKNNLDFLGWADFVNKTEIKNEFFKSYLKRFPDDIFYKNLDNWNKLEIEYPRIFFNKYSFWVIRK